MELSGSRPVCGGSGASYTGSLPVLVAIGVQVILVILVITWLLVIPVITWLLVILVHIRYISYFSCISNVSCTISYFSCTSNIGCNRYISYISHDLQRRRRM